jgi:hypothetical protein
MRKLQNVTIFGCGPAGLLAAHAAAQAQLDFRIYSIKQQSIMPGAQFLHERIEGITGDEPDSHANLIKYGTKEGYALKVYGNKDAPCSWDNYEVGQIPIWNLGAAYDRLWALYSGDIIHTELTPVVINDLRHEWENALIISTVPAPVLCRIQGHAFRSRKVWIKLRQSSVDANVIRYNGDGAADWYRSSFLFGWWSEEYGHPVAEAIEGTKPLYTDCGCCPEVKRLGRFGRWTKGVLVNHAYHGAKQLIVHELARRSQRAV